jgi:hypothetical protein
MSPVESFLLELDRLWDGEGRVTLRVIGSVALMLQVEYVRPTKDSDVLEVASLTASTRERLRELGGKGTPLAERHQVYLDIVPAGLPFLPRPPLFHTSLELSAKLKHFEIKVLDVVDVVISKLKRFSVNDQGDIEKMAELGVIDPVVFVERLQNAFEGNSMSAIVDDYPKILANFHAVQRDWLYMDETEMDLPSW